MPDSFQRLFMMSEPEVLSLNAQAALGPVYGPERSQFSHLVRHFLERFFNHETASPDGDSKTRLVLTAFATGLPPFIVGLYLWPVYHPFIAWPPGRPLTETAPPYWLQVNHHLFFVLYSFVAMGIITVFEWDLFLPDLLDIFVLRPLPIAEGTVFLARVAAIAIFVVGFLFDANILASLIVPVSVDPSYLAGFLVGHLLAVAGSGLFAAVFILALQGVLISVLGERLFRKFSLLMQGLTITVLLMLLLLFPVLSEMVPVFLQSGSVYARCFPPFWFLGIYQRLMEGPSALPVYAGLAQTGCLALLVVVLLAVLTYPLAYLRSVRRLVEGPGTRDTRNWLGRPFDLLLQRTVVRPPLRRAVFHFIGQTILRVPRYRIYLVLYGGVGLSVVVATILRVAIMHQSVRMEISADGIRAAIGVITFWMIAGMRMAFVSSGNQQGNWVFRVVHGRPPLYESAMEQLLAAKVWVLLWSITLTLGACLAFRTIAPAELLSWRALAAQIVVAGGMCLLLTDSFFLNVTTVAFTGEPPREQSVLAITVLKYFAAFPLVLWLPVISEPWIEMGVQHFMAAGAAVAVAHLILRALHRRIVKGHSSSLFYEDGEDWLPMKLGLRD
jgi:hypothetical protein